MKKLDARFDSVWDAINNLQMNKVSVNGSHTMQFLRDNIRGIEKALQDTMNTQSLLVAALVEAGILVEKTKESRQYLEIDNKQYTIRKVK